MCLLAFLFCFLNFDLPNSSICIYQSTKLKINSLAVLNIYRDFLLDANIFTFSYNFSLFHLINYKNKLHLHAQIGEKIIEYAYNITVGSKRKKKDY